ncbi:hypothetical protein RV040_001421 [Vibrio alginolyticus]|nr:hypothetical protein [Vibrio alginolyticus]ELA9241742.1 hypothetical protein [Vibrio alginolyticus]ELK8497942.1 hypothetical protein [Vibrio alginolyticus]MBE3788234.1 hypothetical protein [Vibrio parahaemolyticus]
MLLVALGGGVDYDECPSTSLIYFMSFELPFTLTNNEAVFISLIAPYAITKIGRVIEGLRPSFRGFPLTRGIVAWKREKRYQHLREVRKLRTIPAVVNESIAKAYSYFVLFWAMVFFYLYLAIDSPLKNVFEGSAITSFILALPLFYVEIVWLNAFAKKNSLISSIRGQRV